MDTGRRVIWRDCPHHPRSDLHAFIIEGSGREVVFHSVEPGVGIAGGQTILHAGTDPVEREGNSCPAERHRPIGGVVERSGEIPSPRLTLANKVATEQLQAL